MDETQLTIKQGKEFMIKLKKLTKEDFEKCPNIVILLADAICNNKPINYDKCNFTCSKLLVKYNKDNKTT